MSVTGNGPLRVCVAALLAPIVPGALLLFLSVLSGKFSEGFWWFKLSALAAYPAMAVFGLPVHLLLRRFEWSRFLAYLLAGATVGVVCAFVIFESVLAKNFSLHGDAETSLRPFLGLCVLAGIFGAVTGSAFWLIAQNNDLEEE
jgi:hypothetical protein